MINAPRKWIVNAVSLIVLLLGTTAQVRAYQKPAGTLLIRPFGDSITYGFGFTDYTYCPTYAPGQKWCGSPLPIGGGYRGWMTWMVLASMATKTPPPFTFMTEGHQNGGSYSQQWQTATQAHDGYPGFRTDQLLPTSTLPSFADITLVHVGTNDILQGRTVLNGKTVYGPTFIADAATNLFTILGNLLTQDVDTQVFVAKIIPFAKPASTCKYSNGSSCFDYTIRNKDVATYNNLIQQNWNGLTPDQQQRITIVDMSMLLNGSSGIAPNDDYSIDGIHPGPMGYMKMACTWTRAIKGISPVPAPEPNRCAGIGPPPPPMPTPEQMEQMMRNLPLP